MLNYKYIFFLFFIPSMIQAAEAPVGDQFDIDGNDKIEALSDGLLVLRYLFGFQGEALINQAIGDGATRTTANAIESYLDDHLADLDIDGNGKTEPLSDGLLVLRYLFGFTGDALTNGAIGEQATRTSAAEIEAFFRPNTRLRVTLSCRKGTVPYSNSATVPLNAFYIRTDYVNDYEVSGLVEVNSLEKFGADGIADFILPAGVDQIKVSVLPHDLDGAFPVSQFNVANAGDTEVFVEKGKIVTKNFILEQAHCDQNRDIRGIGATSTTEATNFFVTLNGLSDDYDPEYGISPAVPLGIDKMFYTRRLTTGDIETKVTHSGSIYAAFKLKEPRRFMRIKNIQTVRRIKRVCADATYNLDMTIKSDMELGIKEFQGEGPTGFVNCRKSYTTHMPVSYINDYGDDDFYAVTKSIGLFPENDSTRENAEFRSTCESEAAMLEAPFDWNTSCFEADQTSSKIFEYIPGDPIGRVHDFTVRFDLGGPELVKGKVNAVVDFD